MALSRLNYNSLNVTPTASKGIGFDSGADDLAATFSGGSMTFISKFTSDGSDDTATFASGIDSTYKEYLFIFNNIHGETDNKDLTVGFRDGSTAYDATKTTTIFEAYHAEADTHAAFAVVTGGDIAQGTGFQALTGGMGDDNEDEGSGYLHLFNPSSTTFVKHFIAQTQSSYHTGLPMELNWYVAGYCNTTSAIDGVQFKMSSGNIDAGTFKMYGVN